MQTASSTAPGPLSWSARGTTAKAVTASAVWGMLGRDQKISRSAEPTIPATAEAFALIAYAKPDHSKVYTASDSPPLRLISASISAIKLSSAGLRALRERRTT